MPGPSYANQARVRRPLIIQGPLPAQGVTPPTLRTVLLASQPEELDRRWGGGGFAMIRGGMPSAPVTPPTLRVPLVVTAEDSLSSQRPAEAVRQGGLPSGPVTPPTLRPPIVVPAEAPAGGEGFSLFLRWPVAPPLPRPVLVAAAPPDVPPDVAPWLARTLPTVGLYAPPVFIVPPGDWASWQRHPEALLWVALSAGLAPLPLAPVITATAGGLALPSGGDTGYADITLTFSATGAASYLVSLDGVPYAGGTSPAAYAGLALGVHVFSVEGVNASGTGPASSFTWTVVARVAPASVRAEWGPQSAVEGRDEAPADAPAGWAPQSKTKGRAGG